MMVHHDLGFSHEKDYFINLTHTYVEVIIVDCFNCKLCSDGGAGDNYTRCVGGNTVENVMHRLCLASSMDCKQPQIMTLTRLGQQSVLYTYTPAPSSFVLKYFHNHLFFM